MADHPLVEQYKRSVDTEITASRLAVLTGTIIGYSASGSRKALMDADAKDAQDAYKTGQYDVALDKFCHYLAVVESDPKTGEVSEMRATLTSNIGTCLHFLGQSELAAEYYERALAEFAKCSSALSKISVTWLVYGDINVKRVEYINARLACIKAGNPPDGSTYQDGYGKERKWSKEEQEGRVATWHYYDPRTWFGSSGYGSLGSSSSAPPTVPASSSTSSSAYP